MVTTYHLSACLPFIGTLLSISLLPLISHHFWEKYQNWIFVFWGILAVGFVLITESAGAGVHTIAHNMYGDYIPFILTIGTLYLVTTGMKINLSISPSTTLLTTYLACGAVLASFIGTTGASVLLIYPLIDLIQQRKRKTHVILFFIFLVSNCGGALTPLGDPPLLMGYLHGIPFLWPLKHLFTGYALTNVLLLGIFAVWDKVLLRQEAAPPHIAHRHFSIDHSINLLWLALTIGIVFISGSLKDPDHTFLTLPEWIVNNLNFACLIGLSLISLRNRKVPVHWAPILEVAKIFAVIFIALIPVISLLEANSHPYVVSIRNFANPYGIPDPLRYFWLTGLFSAFLDNAPTYLLFFNMASGQPQVMLEKLPHILKAISLGSIFMGAFTYIGNAPNLMVRAIAADQHIRMPSFVGYMGYTTLILLPVFALVTYVLL